MPKTANAETLMLSLNSEAIGRRLAEIAGEARALKVLLRAAEKVEAGKRGNGGGLGECPTGTPLAQNNRGHRA